MAEKMKTQTKQRQNIDGKMSIWEHLKDLKKCIVVIALTYLAASVGCYYFAPEFVSYMMSLADGYSFVQTGVAELMAQFIKVSLIAGAVVDSPIIVWQLVKFVGPGLKRSEEIKFLAVLIGGLILFAVGALFATFIVVPFSLQFFLNLNTIDIGGMYAIKEYIGYIVSLLFSFGLIFEIPIAVSVLTSLGLMKPQWMRSGRRIILVVCFLIGAIITPPDVVSQCLVALPMYLLFEASVVLSTVIYNARCKKLIAQGIDPDEEYLKKQQKKQKTGRWAAAKAAVERNDAQKKK